MSDDINDYQPNVNPFQMDPAPNADPDGGQQPGQTEPQPPLTFEQALDRVPKTITYGDLAVAHLRKMAAEADGTNEYQFDELHPNEPGLEAPFLDPVDIVAGGLVGKTKGLAMSFRSPASRMVEGVITRGKSILNATGRGLVLDRMSDWNDSR